jgi:superoxide dismutase, Cu-Zn family
MKEFQMLRNMAAASVAGLLLIAATAPPLQAPLQDGSGVSKGVVSLKGTRLTLKATGLAPGIHGVHVHEAGLCQGPDFKSAGGHWNPMMKQHGRDNPMGAHSGDLPNITIDKRGRGTLTIAMPADTMTTRPAGGLSLVVHAAPDDYKTDPSGSSGARIACAVLFAPAVMDR